MSSVLLRGAVLVLLVLTQLLTPLLHGHFGTPIQTGLHVHAGLPAETDSHSQFIPSASRAHPDGSASSGDAFEVDVEAGLGPLGMAMLMPPMLLPGLWILTLLLLAALATGTVRRAPRYFPPVPRRRFCFSHPPPAQAPPPLC